MREPMQRMQDSKTFGETGESDSALALSDTKNCNYLPELTKKVEISEKI
jgi:hypothetical protein